MLLDFNEKTGKWEVKESHTFVFGESLFTIEERFESDLASVPRALWWLFPPFGNYTEPSIVHDWLYKTRKLKRKDADNLFFLSMLDKGVNKYKALLFYTAVRLFGWLYYGKK